MFRCSIPRRYAWPPNLAQLLSYVFASEAYVDNLILHDVESGFSAPTLFIIAI